MSFVKQNFYLSSPMKLFLFLMREFGISQAEAQRWIDRGRVRQGGEKILHKSASVQGAIEVLFFAPDSRGLEPLFIAPDFALFDKPADLLIHPKGTFEHYSLIDEVRARFGAGAQLVHRLDKETSGLVLISRHAKADLALKQAFMNRAVHKRYLALVRGRIAQKMELDFPLAMQDKHQDLGVRVRVEASGKESLTQIYPLEYDRGSDTTLVSAIPLTGRTHQIRAHLAQAGHAILGDPLYGARDEDSRAYLEGRLESRLRSFGASRLMLHAEALRFPYQEGEYWIYSGADFGEAVREAREERGRFLRDLGDPIAHGDKDATL